LRDTGDIKYLGGNLCGILRVILCGREFTLSRVTSGYSNSLANCGNEVVGKLRKIPGGKPWKSIGGKPWKHLVKGTKKKGGTSCNIILGGNPWTHPGGKPWSTLIGKPMENVDNKGKPLLENCRQNDGKLGKPLTTSGGKPRRNNIH
jgi:hypothetical protein